MYAVDRYAGEEIGLSGLLLMEMQVRLLQEK
jgi:hypothetical protein